MHSQKRRQVTASEHRQQWPDMPKVIRAYPVLAGTTCVLLVTVAVFFAGFSGMFSKRSPSVRPFHMRTKAAAGVVAARLLSAEPKVPGGVTFHMGVISSEVNDVQSKVSRHIVAIGYPFEAVHITIDLPHGMWDWPWNVPGGRRHGPSGVAITDRRVDFGTFSPSEQTPRVEQPCSPLVRAVKQQLKYVLDANTEIQVTCINELRRHSTMERYFRHVHQNTDIFKNNVMFTIALTKFTTRYMFHLDDDLWATSRVRQGWFQAAACRLDAPDGTVAVEMLKCLQDDNQGCREKRNKCTPASTSDEETGPTCPGNASFSTRAFMVSHDSVRGLFPLDFETDNIENTIRDNANAVLTNPPQHFARLHHDLGCVY
jgi:hypothetical protein